MFSRDTRIPTEGIPKSSTNPQGEGNQEKLKKQLSWHNCLREAYKANSEMEAKRLENKDPEETRQAILPEIQARKADLDHHTSHAEQQVSSSLEGLTLHNKGPSTMRVSDLTRENRASLAEIYGALNDDASQKGRKAELTNEQLRDIRLLARVAVVQSENISSRREDRKMEEMNHELTQYSAITDQIKGWAKFLSNEGDVPELLSPELRREYDITCLEAMYRVAMPLLKEFKKSFPEAAELIQGCIPAVELVADAAKANVVFGGYAEDGPLRDEQGYIINNHVYVPKAPTDDPTAAMILPMRTFSFEAHNGIRAPEINRLVEKADQSKLTAEEFAYSIVRSEIDGIARLRKIWAQIKPQLEKTSANPTNLNKYDTLFNFTVRKEEYKEGKKYSNEELVEIYLNRKYSSGKYKGMTAREYYIQEYYRRVQERHAAEYERLYGPR